MGVSVGGNLGLLEHFINQCIPVFATFPIPNDDSHFTSFVGNYTDFSSLSGSSEKMLLSQFFDFTDVGKL